MADVSSNSGTSPSEPAAHHDDPYNVGKATAIEVETFIKDWKNDVVEADLYNDDLWFLFHEEFARFSPNDFAALKRATRSNLRTFLYTRGVYVPPHNSRLTISNALYGVLQQETAHRWTTEDLQSIKDEACNVT